MLVLFTERLHRMVQTVEGARAAAIIGRDGIPVERIAASQEPNLDLATAQFTDIVKRLQSANEELGAGELREMIETTDRYAVILRTVTRDYLLLMILDASGSLGRARFELRKAAAELHPELV